MKERLRTVKRLWLWPVILGALTLSGLLVALIRAGPWDWLGAVCIAIPAILAIRLIIKAARGG